MVRRRYPRMTVIAKGIKCFSSQGQCSVVGTWSFSFHYFASNFYRASASRIQGFTMETRLAVDGEVEQVLSLSFADLSRLDESFQVARREPD